MKVYFVYSVHHMFSIELTVEQKRKKEKWNACNEYSTTTTKNQTCNFGVRMEIIIESFLWFWCACCVAYCHLNKYFKDHTPLLSSTLLICFSIKCKTVLYEMIGLSAMAECHAEILWTFRSNIISNSAFLVARNRVILVFALSNNLVFVSFLNFFSPFFHL